MKSKIFGTLVCIMLVTTGLTVTMHSEGIKLVENKNQEQMIFEQPSACSVDVDVPVWNVGDTWTYKVDDVNFGFVENNQSIYLNLKIDELPLEVVDDAGDSYMVSFSAELIGGYAVDINLEGLPISFSGDLTNTTIEGNIFFRKSDLGIEKINVNIVGPLTRRLLDKPCTTIDLNADFDVPYTIIDFPLNTSKVWDIPATNVTLGGTIDSIWLFFAKIMFFIADRILPPDVYLELRGILSEIFENVTFMNPIIDVAELLDLIFGTHTFQIPGTYWGAMSCFNLSSVTVPAGTYLAYNISANAPEGETVGNIYYNSTVGNIVKIVGHFNNMFTYIDEISMELIETNRS